MGEEGHPVATVALQLFRMLLKCLTAPLLKRLSFSINRTAEPRPGSISDDTRSICSLCLSEQERLHQGGGTEERAMKTF